MFTTIPLTILLVSLLLKDCSSISAKVSPSADTSTAAVSALSAVSAVSATDSVASTSFSLISSDMVFSTSLIITEGVDAPAVTPTTLKPEKSLSASSAAVSIKKVGAFCEHTSFNLQVLEEWRPPITTIASHSLESAYASCCLSEVALHIVANISQFVHTFLRIFSHFFHSSRLNVVCDTQITSFFCAIL